MKVTSKNTIVIGTKGTAIMRHFPKDMSLGQPFQVTWTGYETTGISPINVCSAQADGKSATTIHAGFACYDTGCFLSNRSGQVTAYPLNTALAKGLVKKVSLVATVDGKTYPFTGYVKSEWKAGQAFNAGTGTQYIATLDKVATNNSGRVETKPISDGRAIRLYARVSEPKASKASKPTSKASTKPTTTAKPANKNAAKRK